MKKLSVLFLSIVALATTVTSCSKDSSTPAATALELTVNDELGSPVSGATVKIYAALADLNAGTNVVGTGTSDASGKVTFNTNLKAIVYYFDASKDCKNNLLTNSYQTTALTANTTTKTIAKISAVATLTITNASTTDAYNLYVGTQLLNTQGALAVGFSQQLPIPAGQDFVFKAVKLAADGVTETTDTVSKTVNIACGQTDAFSFPTN